MWVLRHFTQFWRHAPLNLRVHQLWLSPSVKISALERVLAPLFNLAAEKLVWLVLTIYIIYIVPQNFKGALSSLDYALSRL